MSSSTDKRLRERAIALTPENRFNVATNSDAFPLEQFNGVLTRPADKKILNIFHNNIFQAATTAVGNLLSSGGQCDVTIPAKTLQIADRATLFFNVTNSSGAATTLCNSIQLIDYIQIMGRNQQQILSQIDGDYLYCLTTLYSSEEWSRRSRLMNITSQWGNGTAIAAGASIQYYVPLEGTLFNQVKLNIEQIDGDFTFRIQFRPFAQTNAAAGTAPTLSQVGVVLNQINLDNMDAMRKRSIYSNGNLSLRYLDPTPQKFPGQALQPGQTYDYTLSALRGLCSHFFFFVRASGATGNNLKTFQSIGSFDILDLSGVSIINYVQPASFNLFHEQCEIFPNSSFAEFNNVYVYHFALSPQDNYDSGMNSGYYPFSGNERLRITTPSTLVAGNFDVVVYPVLYQQCKITQGNIMTTRS